MTSDEKKVVDSFVFLLVCLIPLAGRKFFPNEVFFKRIDILVLTAVIAILDIFSFFVGFGSYAVLVVVSSNCLILMGCKVIKSLMPHMKISKFGSISAVALGFSFPVVLAVVSQMKSENDLSGWFFFPVGILLFLWFKIFSEAKL